MKRNKKPSLSVNKAIRLKDDIPNPTPNVVLVHNMFVKNFTRKKPVLIRNKASKKWTIRYIIGAGSYPGVTKESIAIDYDGLVELGIKHKEDVSLEITRPSFLKIQVWLWKSNDLHNKYGTVWGIIGTILGIASFFF